MRFLADDNSVHVFPDDTDIGVVHGVLSRYNAAVSQGANPTGPPSTGDSTDVAAPAPEYDGLCQMRDGSVHPFLNSGPGMALIFGSQAPNITGQTGLGIGASGAQAPTLTKRGGIAGGGRSGKVTSPASKAFRGLTGSSRLGALKPFTGTASIGGSLAKGLPYWGGLLGLFDFYNQTNGLECRPLNVASSDQGNAAE